MKLTYQSAGVDITRADRIKDRIARLASVTFNSRTLVRSKSFGGLFHLDQSFKNPVLVSSTDGVGTKLKIAFLANRHDTVGQDLVNHCINDILVHGARPLFFLDYIGCGSKTLQFVPQLISGLSRACKAANCALIGGETAQLPEFYREKEYDLAGFIVGAVEKEKLLDGRSIKPGDQIIGLASCGLHTNGYTLARKILLDRKKWKLSRYIPELKSTLEKELLKVHRSYSLSLHPLLTEYKIKGLAHITGGGIQGNLIRILPEKMRAQIDTESWMIPPIFQLLQKAGRVKSSEMFKTFNMGIGMIAVVRPQDVRSIIVRLSRAGETVHHIGEITSGKKSVQLLNLN